MWMWKKFTCTNIYRGYMTCWCSLSLICCRINWRNPWCCWWGLALAETYLHTFLSFSLPCVPVYMAWHGMAVWGISLQVETLKIKGCACWALVLLLPREASTPLWAQRKFSRLRCVTSMQPVSTRWEGFDDMFCLHYTGSLTTKYLNSHPCMPPLSYMYNTI